MPNISKTELIKLQKSLKTDAAIGEKFGVTRQAIQQLRVKFGIPSNLTKNDERNAKIIELYKKGLTGTEIAKKLDLSISQTYRMINLAEKKTPAKKKKK
jgi:DNA-directed RNA polymerase specialized sigma subunit